MVRMTDPTYSGTGSHAVGDDRPQVSFGDTNGTGRADTRPDPADFDAAGFETTPDGRPDISGRSVGELIGEVTGNLSKLMRQEVELAKVELKAEVTKAGKGAGMLGGAGVAGHLALIFLSLTLMFVLDTFMMTWLAALIVTVLWVITAAVLAGRGRKELKNVNPKPEQTVETLKEDVRWAKTRTS